MSTPKNITRIAICTRCQRPYWNTGPAICGRCEEESSLGVPKAKPARRVCVSILSTVQGDCAGCGKFTRIDLRDGHCVGCQRVRYERNRGEVLKQKVRCEVCSQVKRRAYLTENICQRCALIQKNDVALCIHCDKERVIAVKKNGPLCLRCYQNRDAAKRLRRLLNDYCGPNQAYLTQLVEKIDWKAVDEDTRRRFRDFLMYLKAVVIPEPLTWEWIDENMPSLSGEKRKRSEAIRSCLWDVAYIQVALGKLEDREPFRERKRIDTLVKRMPEQSRKEISDYVDWMKQMKFSPYTIYDRLISIAHFQDWLDHRGVSFEDMTDFLFEEFEEFYRWQWTCTGCDTQAGYDIYGDTPNCPECGMSMVRTRWHANRTVGSACQNIKAFLDWLFDSTENKNKFSVTLCLSPTFRHYPKDTVAQIMKFVASPKADPIEAFVFYLILFHICSPWELMHAQLPLDENGKVQTLCDARCIIMPDRALSRGNLSTGRAEKQIEFDPALFEWLSALLKRVDERRANLLNGLNNKYVLLTPGGAKHQKPVTSKFIKNTIDRGCSGAGVPHCTAKTLRLTAAAMFADAGVAGILGIMGWSKKRAYELGWLENREVILPGVRKIARKRNDRRQPPAGALAK